MVIIHRYMKPRKHKDADCKTCRFTEPTRTLDGEEALFCTERMYDDKEHRCYLPKEENQDENS